jgi:CheY-like chemotaxis protein
LAVEAVAKRKYDVILMDCMVIRLSKFHFYIFQMPEMSGTEATACIKKTIPEEQQPRAIIALTANVYEENKKECLSVGMNDVLTKPISISKLKALLSKYTQ